MTITITIPVFNVADYLDCCVESIVNQTYRDIEIILVDDGSTDGSQTRCDEWAEKDKRIKVVHQENKGLYMARRTGASNATGDYVLALDADDWLDLDACEKIADEIEHTSADVIQYGLQVECDSIDDSVISFYQKCFRVSTNNLIGSDEMLVKCYVERKIPWNIATKVIRTSIINQAYDFLGEHRINQLEDFLTGYCVFLNSRKWHRVDGKFYHYRYGTGMSTSMHMSLEELNKKSGYYDAFEKLKKLVCKRFTSDSIAYQVLMNSMSSYIYRERYSQLHRNHLYPRCRFKKHKSIRDCDAILDTVDNFDYTINKTVAVHLHIEGEVPLIQYRKALDNIPVSYRLFVSVPDSNSIITDKAVRKELSFLPNADEIVLQRVPLKEGDIMPLFSFFKDRIMQHDILLHMQIKNNLQKSHTEHILSHLLPKTWTKTILLMLSENAGMVIAAKCLSGGWMDDSQNHNFWVRTDCLKPSVPFGKTNNIKDFFRIKNRFEKLMQQSLFADGLNVCQLFISERERRHLKKMQLLVILSSVLLLTVIGIVAYFFVIGGR